MNERVPFEGQNLESSLSDPMSAEDIADITDASSAETERAMGGTPDLFDSKGKLRDGMPPEEEEFNPDAEAEHLRRIMTSRQVPMRDALSLLKNEPYDWQGQEYDTHCPKCQKGIYRQDEDDLFMIQNAGMCTDCMMPKKAMTSRQVPMRDAWDILKFGYPSVAGGEFPEEVRARHNVASKCQICQGKLNSGSGGEGMVCENTNCPAQMMIQSEGQPPRLRFPAEMFPTANFNSLEEMIEHARNNPDYSRDMYS
jgi:hypothetical protein